jgi:uncharacterized membrane protein
MRSLDLVLAITSSFLHICPVRCPVRGTDEAVTRVRRYLWIEVLLFPLLPAFAAAMARGHGS